MANLRIDSGAVKLTINDDPNRVIEFNPVDAAFAERTLNLYYAFVEKQKEIDEKADLFQKSDEPDENGIPQNALEQARYMREVGDYLREQVDLIFGEGTSQTVFGNSFTFDMFEQFLNGVTEHLTDGRKKIVDAELARRKGRTAKSK